MAWRKEREETGEERQEAEGEKRVWNNFGET